MKKKGDQSISVANVHHLTTAPKKGKNGGGKKAAKGEKDFRESRHLAAERALDKNKGGAHREPITQSASAERSNLLDNSKALGKQGAAGASVRSATISKEQLTQGTSGQATRKTAKTPTSQKQFANGGICKSCRYRVTQQHEYRCFDCRVCGCYLVSAKNLRLTNW
jgi:hypothetical protein